MRATVRVRLMAPLWLCLPGGLPSCPQRPRPAVPRQHSTACAPVPRRLVRLATPRTPSQEALWSARWYRTQAVLEVSRKRDALEAWDPALDSPPPGSSEREGLRLGLMASNANLCRALAFGEQAAHLARTPDEAYQAAEFLLTIDHELGRREQEMHDARKLAALQPRSKHSLQARGDVYLIQITRMPCMALESHFHYGGALSINQSLTQPRYRPFVVIQRPPAAAGSRTRPCRGDP